MERTDSVTRIVVRTRLTNNSRDTFKYIEMSCFDPYVVITNSPFIQQANECFKNIPELFRIPPEQTITKDCYFSLSGSLHKSKIRFTPVAVLTLSENIEKLVRNKQGALLSYTVKSGGSDSNSVSNESDCTVDLISMDGKKETYHTTVETLRIQSDLQLSVN